MYFVSGSIYDAAKDGILNLVVKGVFGPNSDTDGQKQCTCSMSNSSNSSSSSFMTNNTTTTTSSSSSSPNYPSFAQQFNHYNNGGSNQYQNADFRNINHSSYSRNFRSNRG